MKKIIFLITLTIAHTMDASVSSFLAKIQMWNKAAHERSEQHAAFFWPSIIGTGIAVTGLATYYFRDVIDRAILRKQLSNLGKEHIKLGEIIKKERSKPEKRIKKEHNTQAALEKEQNAQAALGSEIEKIPLSPDFFSPYPHYEKITIFDVPQVKSILSSLQDNENKKLAPLSNFIGLDYLKDKITLSDRLDTSIDRYGIAIEGTLQSKHNNKRTITVSLTEQQAVEHKKYRAHWGTGSPIPFQYVQQKPIIIVKGIEKKSGFHWKKLSDDTVDTIAAQLQKKEPFAYLDPTRFQQPTM
jgi:hypothetical protein